MSEKVSADIDRLLSADSYFDLAKDVAGGKSIKADRIADACRNADRTGDDFRTLVASIEQRQQLREQHAGIGDIDKQLKEINAEVAEANAKLEQAEQEHYQTTRPLQIQADRLRAEKIRLAQIPQQLARECPHEGLRQRRKDNALALNQQTNTVNQLRRQYERNRASEVKQPHTEQEYEQASKALTMIVNQSDDIHQAMVDF